MRKKSISLLSFIGFALLSAPCADADLSYQSSGNLKGIPIVFVHAFPLDQTMWNEQVEAVKDFAHVITFDIRGFGMSTVGAPYTLEFVVDDLITVLDRLKIKKAVICGLSMGGYVALRAIERNPERFSGAILADTKSEPDSDASKLGRYKALKTIKESGVEKFIGGFLKTAIAPAHQAANSKVFDRALKISLSNKAQGVSAGLLALTSRTDTTPDLDKIHLPTLVIQGELDSVIPMTAAKSLHEKIANSEFYVVPGAGHLSNLENVTAFNRELIRFLKKLNP